MRNAAFVALRVDAANARHLVRAKKHCLMRRRMRDKNLGVQICEAGGYAAHKLNGFGERKHLIREIIIKASVRQVFGYEP